MARLRPRPTVSNADPVLLAKVPAKYISSDADFVAQPSYDRKYVWIGHLDGNHCDCCGDRHGTIFSLEDWASIGKPTCGRRCRCALIPVMNVTVSGGFHLPEIERWYYRDRFGPSFGKTK